MIDVDLVVYPIIYQLTAYQKFPRISDGQTELTGW
jgi:hypothetical protein